MNKSAGLRLFQCHDDNTVSCRLCSHFCRLQEGERGRCGVRRNDGGRIVSLVYGKLVAESIDPIEKKPLFHLLPGSLSYSIATRGCNFHCAHCQNSHISQVERGEDFPLYTLRKPEEVVAEAVSSGCASISYTYVEPTVFFEFAYDCSVLAVEEGMKNIFVSNGFMSPQLLEVLVPVLSGANIDLKSFSDSFYRKQCGGRLQPVLETIRFLKEKGVWLEVTTLVIPGYNDSDRELNEIAAFIASVDVAVPWHVTGFYPAWKMNNVAPTPVSSLVRAREAGLRNGLHFVYTGNRPGSGEESSFCPGCGKEIITRYGFRVEKNFLAGRCCPACGREVPGVWE
ncbi:AmmeMemoRadiSam system radical SAM enzyme [Desulfomarina sp.]